MEALYLISYPYIMMAKSSSVLQIALLGVFCNQMKDQKEKFGRGKIINAFIVTLGVILFKLFDPETSFQSQISRQT
jgi:drug/metabolite transporter (DMT)-like permease